MVLRKILLAGAALAVCSFAGAAYAEKETTHDHKQAAWGYAGNVGAAHWGKLDESYHLCKSGKMQSPINIAEFMQEDLPKLKIAYAESPLMVGNDGRTINVSYEPGSKFMSDEKVYDLAHIHFHTPSEHYIDGAPYPMEMHLVHTTPEGELAVLGVMMKVGAHNHTIQKIWENIPAAGTVNKPEGLTLRAGELLPMKGTYYTYPGSLTVPPCSEGVKWHLLQQHIEISMEQLNAFQTFFPNNARPIQPMNGRVVKGG